MYISYLFIIYWYIIFFLIFALSISVLSSPCKPFFTDIWSTLSINTFDLRDFLPHPVNIYWLLSENAGCICMWGTSEGNSWYGMPFRRHHLIKQVIVFGKYYLVEIVVFFLHNWYTGTSHTIIWRKYYISTQLHSQLNNNNFDKKHKKRDFATIFLL